jgi:hypothetical protein
MLTSGQDFFSGVRIIAYLHDIVLQGPYDAVKRAYSELRAQLSTAGLQSQREKSLVHSPDPALAAELAFQLGFQQAVGGLVVAGCPAGMPEFIAAKAISAAEGDELLVNALTQLQLRVQDQLLVFRQSLHFKVAHLARCVPYELAEPALQRSEAAVLTDLLSLIGRQQAYLDTQQLYLPLCKGGLGLLCLTDSQGVVSRAGLLAAATLTQSALDTASGGGLFHRDSYLVWIKREISVALIKGNARIFRRYVGFLVQGVGQRFVHGCDLSCMEE